jgi:hypothetical protein
MNSPEGLEVQMRVDVNESLVANFTLTLPSLTAGTGTITVTPSPPIMISPNSTVRVALNTEHLLDEIDNTNNIREEILPHGPSLVPYKALLALPKIKRNIIWQGRSGVQNYSRWTESQKRDLINAILALEKGEPQALSTPPTLLRDNYISAEDDAWKIFLAHVAQSLWVEVHHAVSWHLTDFPDDQLAYLLDSRKLMSYNQATNKYKFDIMGRITAWNPRICYEFLSNLKMIKSSQLQTIYALTDWMRGHLKHTARDEDFSELFGYAGPPPADKVLYPLEGRRHKTAGCWGTSGLYGAVLRSINIPVEHARTTFNGLIHSRPAFPSVNRSMPHGDDPYKRLLTPSGAVIPSSKIFYTSAEMIVKFLIPPVDCIRGECNTVSEQASYNSNKDHLQLACDYMVDYILYLYARDGANYLNDYLRGPIRRGVVHEYVKPYFTAEERAAIIAAVENKLREIGGGDLEAGKAKVIDRFQRFDENK